MSFPRVEMLTPETAIMTESDALSPDATAMSSFRLHSDAWGRLVLTNAEGRQYVGILPIRAFPLSDPDQWVVLCDAQWRELVAIPDLATLSDENRRVLEAELKRREFTPEILRVIGVSSYLEPAEWEVETDRGRTRFVLKTEDDVRRLGPNSALIVDASGVRYKVPDTRRLDGFSRRAVERYL